MAPSLAAGGVSELEAPVCYSAVRGLGSWATLIFSFPDGRSVKSLGCSGGRPSRQEEQSVLFSSSLRPAQRGRALGQGHIAGAPPLLPGVGLWGPAAGWARGRLRQGQPQGR